jgi:hypothetical protein
MNYGLRVFCHCHSCWRLFFESGGPYLRFKIRYAAILGNLFDEKALLRYGTHLTKSLVPDRVSDLHQFLADPDPGFENECGSGSMA